MRLHAAATGSAGSSAIRPRRMSLRKELLELVLADSLGLRGLPVVAALPVAVDEQEPDSLRVGILDQDRAVYFPRHACWTLCPQRD